MSYKKASKEDRKAFRSFIIKNFAIAMGLLFGLPGVAFAVFG